MPTAAGHRCGWRGCAAIVAQGVRFCPLHQQAQTASRGVGTWPEGVARPIGRPCAEPRCPEVVPYGKRYCLKHEQERKDAIDQERGSASSRGYGANWRRLRGMFLARHPLCVDPDNVHKGSPVVATDVDHIVPRAEGGGNQFSNLQALCHKCHSRKTWRQSVSKANHNKGRGM